MGLAALKPDSREALFGCPRDKLWCHCARRWALCRHHLELHAAARKSAGQRGYKEIRIGEEKRRRGLPDVISDDLKIVMSDLVHVHHITARAGALKENSLLSNVAHPPHH